MKQERYQKEKGVTLIILAVTIVVILILAGITVDYAFKDSGIIKTALGLQNTINTSMSREEQQLEELANALAGETMNIVGGEEIEEPIPTPPTITVTGEKGENGYYSSNVQVILHKSDKLQTMTYKIEGVTDEITAQDGETITITADGTYKIVAYMYNRQEEPSNPATVQFVKDSVAPTVSLQVTDIQAETITVQIAAMDEASGLVTTMPYTFYYKVEGETVWKEAGKGNTSSYTYTNLQPGTTYILKAEATDKAGNIGTSNEIKNVKTVELDTTKPGVGDISNPTKNNIVQGESTVIVITPTEEVTVDQSKFLPVDENGNTTDATVTVEKQEDGTIKITITAGEEEARVDIKVEEGAFTDNAGNANEETTMEIGVTVDNTKPTMEMTYPEEGTVIKKDESIDIVIIPSEEVTIDETKLIISGEEETGSTTIITESPDGTITITITGGTGTGNIQVTIEEGFIIDKAGNSNEKEVLPSYQVDNTKPTVTIEKPAEGTVIKEGETITITLTTSEEVTVDTSKIDLTGEGSTGASIQVTENTDGTITITITGRTETGDIGIVIQPGAFTDIVGNTNTTITETVVKIDNQGPTVEAQVTNQTTNSVTIAVTATDNGPAGLATDDTYTYHITGEGVDKTYTTTSATYTFEGLPAGIDCAITVTVKDNKGNNGSSTITTNLESIPDGTSSITLSRIQWNKNGTVNQEGTAKITLTNNETDFSMQYQIVTDGSSPVEANWIDVQGNSIELDGLYHQDIVYARLLDEAGNTGSVTSSSVIDNEKPIPYMGTMTGNYQEETGWLQEFEIYDTGTLDNQSGLKSMTYKITNGDNIEYPLPTNIKEDGIYDIEIYARDWAGNEATESYNRKLDATAPEIQELSKNTTQPAKEVTITGIAQDTTAGIWKYLYTTKYNIMVIGNEDWTTIEPTNEVYTAPNYTVTTNEMYYFYVADAAGNVSKQEISVYNIDKTAPTITAVGEPSTTYIKNGQTATYSITTSENVTIADGTKATANGCTVVITGSGTRWTATVTGGNGNGAVTLNLEAGLFQDVAGNTTTAAMTKTGLTLDNTAPVFTISSESGVAAKSKNVTVSITETGAGLATTNSYTYYLSTSSSNPTASGYISGIYTSGTPFSIGEGLTGTYYLFLPVVADTVGNTSLETITGYYRAGTYVLDNTAPTVHSMVTSNPGEKGFTVTIDAEDNSGGSGIADSNGYTIYYRQTGESTYNSVTTSSNTYTFTELTPDASYATITADSANAPDVQTGMNPVMWIDLNGNGIIEEATEEIAKYSNLSTKTINSNWTANDGDNQWYYYNRAEVTYDVYVTAVDKLGNISDNSETVSQEIYPRLDHKTSHFANVKMEDGSYFTWIPRYAYKVTRAPSTTASATNAGTIDVKFVKDFGNTAYDGTACTIATSNIDTTTQYVVHPAFCKDVNMGGYETNLTGIWVAKYESSMETNGVETNTYSDEIGDVTTSSTVKVVSKPNRTSWRWITIGNCYTNAKAYNTTLDSHLMKNSEWGATAYLTHSQYGRNGNEIAKNDSSSYYTGRSLGKPAIAAGEYSPEGTHEYNTEGGKTASSTGNIYGIYDLSGGAYEYIATFNATDTNGYYASDGWEGLTTNSPSDKYATKYTSTSNIPTSSSVILGDGIYDVNLNLGSAFQAWFADYSECVNLYNPFMLRGGCYGDHSGAGVFYSAYDSSFAFIYSSFRIVLPGAQEPPPPPTDGSYSEAKGVNTPYLYEGLNPVMWVDLNGNGTIEEATEEIKKYNNITTKEINPVWTENNGDFTWYNYTDNGETLDGKVDHKQSKWANVIDENGSYFVWIPRYAYKITPTTDTTPSVDNAGTIDVKFVKNKTATMTNGSTAMIATSNIDSTTQYVVHPAFCTDVNMGGFDKELSGIWVAKYESSKEESYDNGVTWIQETVRGEYTNIGDVLTTNAGNTSSYIRVVSKPNLQSWRSITIGNGYANAKAYNTAFDSHLMKNSEWGAVAYLTHSQYGRNGNEIAKNDSSSYYTGRSLGKPETSTNLHGSFFVGSYSDAGSHKYNTSLGMLASSTGNIYGIYDLSGGACEYTAAFNETDKFNSFPNYGWDGLSTSIASDKYATKYSGTEDSTMPKINGVILGDGIYDVNLNLGNSTYAWFYDESYCMTSYPPFSVRGSTSAYGSQTGVFASNTTDGWPESYYSFRVVLPGV